MLLLIAIIGSHLTAQNSYQEVMLKQVQDLESANSKEDYINLKNNFNRIGLVRQNWLTNYYEALCAIAWGNLEEDELMSERLFLEALQKMQIARQLKGDALELDILKARLWQVQLVKDRRRFLEIGKKLFELLDDITRKAPDNPRGLLLWCETIYRSPFGAHEKDTIRSRLDKATSLLESELAKADILPCWGYEEARGFQQRFLAEMAQKK